VPDFPGFADAAAEACQHAAVRTASRLASAVPAGEAIDHDGMAVTQA